MKKLYSLIFLILCSCGSGTINEEYVFSLADNKCYKVTETKTELQYQAIECSRVPIDKDCRNTWESFEDLRED